MEVGARLEIANLAKGFDGQVALFVDLNLTVAPGEVVALMGPSGIGKSTLLRLVAGVDRTYAGSISVDGLEAARAPAPGMVFQDARLLPWRTVYDNLRLAAPNLGIPAADRMLAQLGLEGCGWLRPGQLSLGMQRRVAFARALALPRRLLLLDEPFASLDADRVGQLKQLLAEERERSNITVLFATHDSADASRLADRILHVSGRPATITELSVVNPRSGLRAAGE